MEILKVIGILIIEALLRVIVAAFSMLFVWLGWNNFVAVIWDVPSVNIWQAFCASLLLVVIGSAFTTKVTGKDQ